MPSIYNGLACLQHSRGHDRGNLAEHNTETHHPTSQPHFVKKGIYTVAPDMPTNIYVVGAQCTGKTTLVAALQAHFQSSSPRPLVFTEVARTVLREHKFTASDITSSKPRALRFQELILEAQYETEKAAGTSWFISDRSGFDPIVYTKRYVGYEQAELLTRTGIWQELRERMSRSLILVCEAGADWLVDDGTRLMPVDKKDWVAFHDLFCDSLTGAGLEYTVLPCAIRDTQERVRFVVELLGS